MNYNVKRECWNEKTFNGYEDNPYWRIDFRGLSFGLKDDGMLWSIGNKVVTNTDIIDIQRILRECKLEISFDKIELPNILREDYVIWNRKNNCPVESLDIVYHYTTVIDLLNDGIQLDEDEEFVCIKSIPLIWQVFYNEQIERNK
jgi:hypothetical protein